MSLIRVAFLGGKMKFIKGFLGFIMMLFGSMLIAITIDDELIKNILLRIVGAFLNIFISHKFID
jgi:hypothetical protein